MNRPAALIRPLLIALWLFAVVCLPHDAPAREAATNEAALIKILESPAATVREKADACAELKRKGDARSVSALAGLLTNADLSVSARYVLESMPSSKAGRALIQALGKTCGALQTGIINSLAVRREPAAAGALGKLLASPEPSVAIAAAKALGAIGGSSALKSLQGSLAISTGPLHEADVGAILACAAQLAESGKTGAARKIYEQLYQGEKLDVLREAAFRGMILTSGRYGTALAAKAIVNGDPSSRAAALQIAVQLEGVAATQALADAAIASPAPIQAALIECLVQRGDPAAQPALSVLADSEDAPVRLAALAALGKLGDDSCVRLLAERAASAPAMEREAAREALRELNRGPVTARMLRLLDPASQKREIELILALGARGDRTAMPALLNLGRKGNDDERAAALQAIGDLADANQIPAMVAMVEEAATEDSRSQAAAALESIYERIPVASESEVAALEKVLAAGSVDARLALLPICSELTVAGIRAALRSAVTNENARIRDAAIHALCDTHDPALLPDLLDLASGEGADAVRHLAVRGCVHLTSQEEDVKIANDKKLAAFSRLLKGPLDAGEKRLVLSGVAGVADQRALALAVGLLGDADVQAEAEKAVIQLAREVQGAHPAKARAALVKLEAGTKNPDNRQAAKSLLEKMK